MWKIFTICLRSVSSEVQQVNVRFGIKLTITMIVFAFAISFTIATTDYFRLREQAIANKLAQVEQNEKMVKYALENIEKAYAVFGDNIAAKMEESSLYLKKLYEKNQSFDEWDFAELKRLLSFDIYIIDSNNVITHSSYAADIGLDFRACCGKLARLLDERRASGKFYHDGIDIEQSTGMIKKYSYMPTDDKKFIIQLGYSLQNGDIFKRFNFFDTINELVQRSPSLNEIRVLNIGGHALGTPVHSHEHKLTPERRAVFEQVLQSGQTMEYVGEWNNEPAIYRYVNYVSAYDNGSTKHKVLEIIYNDRDLQAILAEHRETFLLQLMFIVAFTILLGFIITTWVAKPMYLAFHDSLTGLYNRAAFDERLGSAIACKKGTTALLMIDLDNFKFVNDRLGHDKGDYLLQCVARCIRKAAREEDIPIRLGGDEFVLIMPSTNREEAEQTASKIIESIVATTAQEMQLDGEKVTVSIGIALAPEHGADPDELAKKADKALYRSKEKGKNQYQFYG